MKPLLALLTLAASLLLAADPVASTITVQIPLTQEQLDALQSYTDRYNNNAGTSTIADRLREDVITPWVKARTDEAYTAAVQRLGEAARGLSYAQRQALIQQVTQQLQANP